MKPIYCSIGLGSIAYNYIITVLKLVQYFDLPPIYLDRYIMMIYKIYYIH